ncbi:hypothetical protein HOY82DRAFT_574971 [Tuber indicum]|nr:hypothetical protein HOY82DRAFT_574971 [Tuber indicum]
MMVMSLLLFIVCYVSRFSFIQMFFISFSLLLLLVDSLSSLLFIYFLSLLHLIDMKLSLHWFSLLSKRDLVNAR